MMNRREFFLPLLASGVVLGRYSPLSMLTSCARGAGPVRHFHISLSTESIKNNPDLPSIVHKAGARDAWIGAAYFGKFRSPIEEIRAQADLIEKAGMKAHAITLPLGHPSDPVGYAENPGARTMPAHWKNGCTYDGTLYSGTSLHKPAVEENEEVLRILGQAGFNSVFLDDDFRLARTPGSIGGCFCDECRKTFLDKYGYGKGDWEELIHSVGNRNLSPVLESWIEATCEKLSGMFSALRQATPDIDLGIMVMYLGSEKAGIELERYRGVPFRVGEFMFNDESFSKLKGKTDELFSVLFHRRFTEPELAYSETTIFPEKTLSAKNLAAKLHISLIADVRNTMFMSGKNPIPVDYWETIAPVMKKSANQHEDIAGHLLRGPLKHYWGTDSRMVGRDNPFSLFLASGIPFEVADEPGPEGWFFLSDEDARAAHEGRLKSRGSKMVIRTSTSLKGGSFIAMDEDMKDLFAFKRRIVQELKDIPYVEGEIPAVFAWYPSAGKAVLWNVQESRQDFRIIRNGEVIRTLTVGGLDSELISC